MDPALQNALMLQAIKSGGQQQMHPPQNTAAAVGANPMAPPAMPSPPMGQAPLAPVDPMTQAGGLGAMQAQMPGMNGMQSQNPIAAALMSQIPGGGQ